MLTISPVTASRPLDFDVLAVDGVSLVGSNQAAVQFADGETTKFLRVQVNTDNELEDLETLTITIADDTPQTTDGINETVVSIIDSSDAGTLTFADDNFTVNESSGELTIDVSRNASTSGGQVVGDLALTWSVTSGSAMVGSDLHAQSGVVEWTVDDLSLIHI